MIQINQSSSEPIYEQIIKQYKYLVLQGYLKSGDAILSVRKLALQLSVTPGTVAKAYQELERIGIIQTIRGKGTFIAKEPMQKTDVCMELLYLGVTTEQIKEYVDTICSEFTDTDLESRREDLKEEEDQ